MIKQYWIVETWLPEMGLWMPSPPLHTAVDVGKQLQLWGNHQIRILAVKKEITEIKLEEILCNTSTF